METSSRASLWEPSDHGTRARGLSSCAKVEAAFFSLGSSLKIIRIRGKGEQLVCRFASCIR